MKNEAELQIALRNGNKDEIDSIFERIYNSYFKLGMFIARQYLDYENSLEIVDEAFVNFYKRILLEQKCEIKNIKQYLCVSIKNASIKESNRINVMVPFDENINYQKNKNVSSVEQLLQEFNEIEQYIITEHVLLDKTFNEIAIELNKPMNTIKSIYRRGCQKARRKLSWIKKE